MRSLTNGHSFSNGAGPQGGNSGPAALPPEVRGSRATSWELQGITPPGLYGA